MSLRIAKKARIDAPPTPPMCRCPDCGALHYRRKGGRKPLDPQRNVRIWQLYQKGRTQRELAEEFGLSRSHITTIVQAERAKAIVQR